MKKVLTLLAAAGIMTAATAAFGATIVGSKHDLSSTGLSGYKGTAANTSQICVYCHAPHNALLSLPLWNRSNPVGSGFTLYSGVGMQSRQFATGFTSDSTSLFCMSCHDGVTSMNAVHNKGALINAGTAGAPARPLTTSAGGVLSGSAAFTDLTKTHPINFPVPTVNNAQNDLWVGGNIPSMGGGAATTTATFPLFKVAAGSAARNTNRSLECGSCHAVHDSLNSPFLRYTMDGSKLCLGCHNK